MTVNFPCNFLWLVHLPTGAVTLSGKNKDYLVCGSCANVCLIAKRCVCSRILRVTPWSRLHDVKTNR